jgi:hypothetical protein
MQTIPRYLHLVAMTSTLIGSSGTFVFGGDELLFLIGVLLLDSYSPIPSLILIIVIIIIITIIIKYYKLIITIPSKLNKLPFDMICIFVKIFY